MAKKCGRYTYEGARQIYLDGKPFIVVRRDGDHPPTVVDATVKWIVKFLNASSACRVRTRKSKAKRSK